MTSQTTGEAILPDFDQLVEAHYSALYRFAFSLAKNEHEACDLTQQTFLTYARKGHSLRDPAKVKSWLFTTLYREFLRVRRRDAPMFSTEPEILEYSAPPVDANAVEQAETHEILNMLDEIEESYRIPMILFYLKELSYKEISQTLEIPMGTVMSRLSRGKALLKDLVSTRSKPQTGGIA